MNCLSSRPNETTVLYGCYAFCIHSMCVCACVRAHSTWLPILMGGPLGPPAKRGDMKDYNRNNIAP